MVSDQNKKNDDNAVHVSVEFLTASAGSIKMSPARYPVYFSIGEGNVRIRQTSLVLEEIAVLQKKIPELEPYLKAAEMLASERNPGARA